jgi:putative PIN family toxin of toxin-antitoxin system
VTQLVLDTNVLVSALLFRSEASTLFEAWRRGRFRLAVSAPILDEYTRVLRHPKLRLTGREAAGIMRRFVLPHCDSFQPAEEGSFCSDPDDDKFIHCAIAARAEALVSGDRALLTVGPRCGGVTIISVSAARARYCIDRAPR